ncbi:MAG TPA: hypothetical protein VN044_05775, partial [Verrucomicrobiae bacterium]|nr:hypothetical protein [Verrucomicrobiae bacterium]
NEGQNANSQKNDVAKHGSSLYFNRSQAQTYATATTKKTTVAPTNIRSLIGTNSPGAVPCRIARRFPS